MLDKAEAYTCICIVCLPQITTKMQYIIIIIIFAVFKKIYLSFFEVLSLLKKKLK